MQYLDYHKLHIVSIHSGVKVYTREYFHVLKSEIALAWDRLETDTVVLVRSELDKDASHGGGAFRSEMVLMDGQDRLFQLKEPVASVVLQSFAPKAI